MSPRLCWSEQLNANLPPPLFFGGRNKSRRNVSMFCQGEVQSYNYKHRMLWGCSISLGPCLLSTKALKRDQSSCLLHSSANSRSKQTTIYIANNARGNYRRRVTVPRCTKGQICKHSSNQRSAVCGWIFSLSVANCFSREQPRSLKSSFPISSSNGELWDCVWYMHVWADTDKQTQLKPI